MINQEPYRAARTVNCTARHAEGPRSLWLQGLAMSLLVLASQAQAAGGNHSVDDAVMTDPGRCEVETWADRERGGGRTLLHAGTACRAGPVELGLSADHMRQFATGSAVNTGLQMKWAHAVTDALSTGMVLSAAWQDTAPRFAGSAIVMPVTWQASETVLLHMNLGREFRRAAPDSNRAGVALEWAPVPAWSFVAERFRESATNFWRGGARHAVNPNMSVDVSRARGLGGSVPGWWSVGFNLAFDR